MVIDYQGIGKRLSQARESLGLSLDEVASRTRIQVKYLEALEQGNVEDLPGSFYVKAFIRQYANTVKIDPNTIFEKYTYPNRQEFDQVQNRVQTLDGTKVVVGKDMLPHSGMPGVNKSFSEKIRPKLPIILLGVLSLVAAVVIWQAVSSIKTTDNVESSSNRVKVTSTSVSSKKESSSSSSEVSSESSSSSQESLSSSSEATTPLTKGNYDGSSITYTFVDAQSHNLTVQSSSNAWTTVDFDGNRTFAGIINSDSPQNINVPEGVRSVVVHSGNPQTMSIQWDNNDVNFRDGAPTITTDVIINRG
ncbi:MAG: helix-turn-helix domain-containing protein [Lactobacillaceae bacterium]|jgi:cytoskeletal protein RodZ|nr:helix-turn-helix domain-containing protein [Lactobacillaceae bacterium]